MEFGGATTQLTNFLTGASGITEAEPGPVRRPRPVGVQRLRGQRLHDLRAGDDRAARRGRGADAAIRRGGTAARGRPAPARSTRRSPTRRSDCRRRKPAAAPAEEYKPKLGLDFAGQPVVAVGVDPFGTYAAGGVSFVFSDMLGNHSLYTGIQATSRFDEIGGNVTYINRTHRWNWGVALDQTPYVYRTFQTGVAFPQGVPTYVEQEYRILQVDRSLTGLLSYPLSRAQRIDFSGGARQIGFSQDLTTRSVRLPDGPAAD